MRRAEYKSEVNITFKLYRTKSISYVRNIFFTGMECHPWYLDQLPLETKLQPRR